MSIWELRRVWRSVVLVGREERSEGGKGFELERRLGVMERGRELGLLEFVFLRESF
jgi:hypothetical protein